MSMAAPAASACNIVRLVLGQLVSGFLCQSEKLFRGLCCFDFFFLLVGEDAEDILGNVHGDTSLDDYEIAS